jgi:hypothetical protein
MNHRFQEGTAMGRQRDKMSAASKATKTTRLNVRIDPAAAGGGRKSPHSLARRSVE